MEEPLLGRASPADEAEKRRVYRNVLLLSFAFMLHYTAMDGMGNLQSSVNAKGGLGTVAFSSTFLATIACSAFLPPIVIRNLGCKSTIAASLASSIPYMVAQFWPSFYSMIPTAVLVGFGSSLLWISQSMYVTVVSRAYSLVNKKPPQGIAVRMFGAFYTVSNLCQVWGNLISSLVLSTDDSLRNNTTNASEICGAYYTPAVKTETPHPQPSREKIYIVAGVYLGCIALAVSIVLLFVDSLSRYQDALEQVSDVNKSAARQLSNILGMWKQPKLLLMIPLPVLNGIVHAFVTADYTASYVSCALGVQYVGYVMICYGLSQSLASLITQKIVKYFGNFAVLSYCVGFLVPVFALLLIWKPNTQELYMYFIIVSLIGFCKGIWGVQIKALFGNLFPGQEESSFSNYTIWECVGLMAAFAYSAYAITWLKIAIIYVVMVAAIAGFIAVETINRRIRENASINSINT